MSQSLYHPTIGLEVHVELSTKSKMFCGCKNSPHDSVPNTHVCPVCLAHPGTLPVPNEEAIRAVLLFGRAVQATAASAYSEFDRKHYFYPDIPKAYQLSQSAHPFLTGGSINGCALTRVHLEEDTARSQHDKGDHSLVDFNRAGVPLMELVTEPVIHDAKTAGNFARELQLILRTLGIATAHMERGEMRVEANVSVSCDKSLGTKVEVKNLNSFRSVEGAIEYEIARQTELLLQGGAVTQETRGWDETKSKTFLQRTKETAKDYRYFPDPDIPKMAIKDHLPFSRLNEIMLEMPDKARAKYKDIGLTREVIEILITNDGIGPYFAQVYAQAQEGAVSLEILPTAANYLVSDVSSLLSQGRKLVMSPQSFGELMELLVANKITSRVAKDLIEETLDTDASPALLAVERGLLRTSDTATLEPILRQIVANNEAVVAEYRAGKAAALQFLIGQGMKATRGSADPAVLSDELKKLLA